MSKRFHIAFSFAGEKREFVAQVVEILANCFGRERILYDKYLNSELARLRSSRYLSELYCNETELIVVVLCKNYDDKHWCGVEWDAIYGHMTKKGNEKDVMLCRFDRATVNGLTDLDGFLDLDDMIPEAVASCIIRRLKINQNHSEDDHAPDAQEGRDWPIEVPPLKWLAAGQNNAQEAFAQLMKTTPSFRLLLIHGNNNTGKSHLTKQFLYNTNNLKTIHDIPCACLDFKGRLMSKALRTFASQLKISRPTPKTDVAEELFEIFICLRSSARPRLIIFDTFEQAESARSSIENDLLVSLIEASWLRVIILGQKVPSRLNTPWQDISSEIRLSLPTVQEWYDYGKQHTPDLDFNVFQQVYKLCEGESALLAQVFGPKNKV